MKTCIKCGSHAFNLYAEEIDQGGLCDVHYWQGRAHRAEAQPEQEPVEWTPGPNLFKDWCSQYFGPDSDDDYLAKAVFNLPPMAQRFANTTLPKRPWVGLTDEKIAEVAERMEASDPTDSFWREFARAIDAKLKEKNSP